MAAPDAPASVHPLGVWRAWREQFGPRFVLGLVGYVVAFLLTLTTIYLSIRAPGSGPIGPATKTILAVVLANLVLILALAAAVCWSVLRLMGARDAGARLHLRFVLWFAMAAVLPAIVVALFFGALVTRGVETWFSMRVRTVVQNSATVARSYVNEQVNTLAGDLKAMAIDLDRAEPLFRSSPVAFGQILEGQAAARPFPAAYVIDHEGRILASAEADNVPPFLAPPLLTVKSVDTGDAAVKIFEQTALVRGLYRLKAYQDAYLYVVRRVEPGIVNNLVGANGALQDYRDAEANRHQIQAVFVLTYLETALLVLVGAVWLGMAAANAISAPVARLVAAADRVAGGDLSARVESHNDP